MFTKFTYFKNAVLLVEVNGKLDIYSSEDFVERVKNQLNRTYTRELVLEFSGVSSVASIGLRAILELHKLMQAKGCSLKLKNVSDDVFRTFEITGFDKFLIIENDSDNTGVI